MRLPAIQVAQLPPETAKGRQGIKKGCAGRDMRDARNRLLRSGTQLKLVKGAAGVGHLTPRAPVHNAIEASLKAKATGNSQGQAWPTFPLDGAAR